MCPSGIDLESYNTFFFRIDFGIAVTVCVVVFICHFIIIPNRLKSKATCITIYFVQERFDICCALLTLFESYQCHHRLTVIEELEKIMHSQ